MLGESQSNHVTEGWEGSVSPSRPSGRGEGLEAELVTKGQWLSHRAYVMKPPFKKKKKGGIERAFRLVDSGDLG